MIMRKPFTALWFAAFLSLAAAEAGATALPVPGLVGPVRWQPGATVTVYIPLDPLRNDPNTKRTRNVQVKQAVDKWIKALQDAGVNLTLKAVTLDANGNDPATNKPPDPKNDTPQNGSIPITFAPVNGSGEHGEANPSTQQEEGSTKTGPLVTDDIKIDDSATANQQKDNDQALATALHELGHALGLDHSKEKDSVMHSALDTEPQKDVGDSDVRELKSVYAAADAHLDGSVVPIGSAFAYTLDAHWLAGGEISMIQVATGGAPIGDLVLPPGWIEALFPGFDHPGVLTFQIDPTDDLQAYLNADNPEEIFTFVSTAPPADTLGWAGDFLDVVGPSVPEPAMGALLAATPLLLRRRRSGRGRKGCRA